MKKRSFWIAAMCLLSSVTAKAQTNYGEVTPFIDQSTITKFVNGTNFPAGWYRVEYVSGAMRYRNDTLLTVHDYLGAINATHGFNIIHSDLGWGSNPQQIPAPGDAVGKLTQIEVEAHNAGKSTTFYHSGGTIGVYLLDSPYSDNTHDGSTPRFKLVGVPCDQLISVASDGMTNTATATGYKFAVTALTNVNITIYQSDDMVTWQSNRTFVIQTNTSYGTTNFAFNVTTVTNRFYSFQIPGCDCAGDTIGFYKKTMVPDYTLIANQLDNPGGNTFINLFPNVPEGTLLYRMISGFSYESWVFSQGEWLDSDTALNANTETLHPGDGVFFFNPQTNNLQIAFSGSVREGNLQLPISATDQIKSSIVPQAGSLEALGWQATEGDNVYKWNPSTQQFMLTAYEFDEWGFTPTVEIGEALVLRALSAKNWTRNFSVCE